MAGFSRRSFLGLAATQINILIDSQFASFQGNGPVSWLNYAFRLMQFPIGMFGVAISLGLFYPFLFTCLLVVAVLVAASRIILGMHFLSDVLGGSAIGVLLGAISYHFFALL